MIPINKPLVYNQTESSMGEIKEILSTFFLQRNLNLVFSGRQGLDIIYRNLYKKYGCLEVAVSPLACFDALYPITKNNHKIHFVDINPRTLNMDEILIPDHVQVIQAIHFGGNPQNMNLIKAIAEKNKQIIIEDCAQGFGALYDNKYVGDFGDYSVFSLMKNIYALGGGLIVSKENINVPDHKELGHIPTLYRIIKRYLESKNTYNSPITNNVLYGMLSLRPTDQTKFYDEYTVNQRIIDSIYSQLIHFDDLLNKRVRNARYILDNIDTEYIQPQSHLPEASPNYTRLYFVLKEGESKKIIKSLREKGIGSNHITQDSLKYFQKSVFKNSVLSKHVNENSLKSYSAIHDKLISIPISPNLSKKEMYYILQTINNNVYY